MGCCASKEADKPAMNEMAMSSLVMEPQLGVGLPHLEAMESDGGQRASVKQTTRIEVDSFQVPNTSLPQLDRAPKKSYWYLGKGSFGKVKLCLDVVENCLVALKVVSKRQIRHRLLAGKRSPSHNAEAELLREISVMQSLSHPNVVQLFEVIDDAEDDKLVMVMEYVEGGEAISEDRLMKSDINDAFSEDIARMHFRDLIKGVDYLHYQNVIHRDIKPENLLLTSKGSVKLADFGSACRIVDGNDKMIDTCGTRPFFSPEMCRNGPYCGMKADIYAVGITLYCMVFMRLPFMAPTAPALFEKIKNTEPDFTGRPDISATLIDLLRGVMEKNPEKRLTIEEIMMHEWFTDRSSLLTIKSSRMLSVPTIDMRASTSPGNVLTPSIDHVFRQIPGKVVKTFQPGSYIVRRGKGIDGVYLIRKGVCVVFMGDHDGDDILPFLDGDEDFQEEEQDYDKAIEINRPPKSTEGAELLNALSRPSSELNPEALRQLSRFQSLPKSEVVKGVGRRTTFQHANLRRLVEQASKDTTLSSVTTPRSSRGRITRGPGSIIGLDTAVKGISNETVRVVEQVEAVFAPKETLEQVFKSQDRKLQLQLLLAKLRKTEVLRDTVQQLASLQPDFQQMEELRSLVRNVS